MHLAEVIDLFLSLPETEETTPFGPDVLVYKVAGKMFSTASPDDVPPRINLKCDPDRAVELRDEHDAILPGYHMNKKHWNTVLIDESLPDSLLESIIRDSYALVVNGLPKKDRERLSTIES